MTTNYISDSQENDEILLRDHRDEFLLVYRNRQQREMTAFKNYIRASEFAAPPKKVLHELQGLLKVLTKKFNETGDLTILAKRETIQSAIDSGDYAIPGTSDWDYRLNRYQFASEFIWPTSEESATREQEKQQLLSLLA